MKLAAIAFFLFASSAFASNVERIEVDRALDDARAREVVCQAMEDTLDLMSLDNCDELNFRVYEITQTKEQVGQYPAGTYTALTIGLSTGDGEEEGCWFDLARLFSEYQVARDGSLVRGDQWELRQGGCE